ncbi:FAD/NAD(P)-binding protein [Streptomyces sp. NPDC048111]|uniref:FAD/NAD(P)-binding protein n=1 Tax=Streptomyces sp. NPDC048111 TaxID=3365500 RepID=UPI00371466A5
MVNTALIGCGPRGLNVLEQLVHRARTRRLTGTVHVIEPGPLGVGIHHPDQPDYLRLNTIAEQVTAFTDEHMTDGGGIEGPSLYEWAARRGLRVRENTGESVPVRPTHHLPRAVLGSYLEWAARRIVAAAPEGLVIVRHRDTAVEVTRADGGRGERVVLSAGGVLDVADAVLTVGHSGTPGMRSPDPAAEPGRWIADPYPLPGTLAHVAPGDTLGVLGAGLTAADVVAAATVGRGGRYEQSAEGRLRYLPSGEEPALVLLSRTGLPARARPRPGAQRARGTVHLSPAGIEASRALRPAQRVDFRHDVLPLVEREMRHRFTALAAARGQRPVLPPGSLTGLVDACVPRDALASRHHYRAWYAQYIEDDLHEAELGLEQSPLKFALEVMRDHREVLRRAVDEPGLTEESEAYFFGSFVPAVNRAVIGPQRQRNAELLALLAAGVARPGPGPGPRIVWETARRRWSLTSTALAVPTLDHADHLVAALSPAPQAAASLSPVVRGLYAAGRIRARRAGPLTLGVDLTRDGRPVGRGGRVQQHLFVLGPLGEGSSYYNHYVVSPGGPSRATEDARRVATLVAPG